MSVHLCCFNIARTAVFSLKNSLRLTNTECVCGDLPRLSLKSLKTEKLRKFKKYEISPFNFKFYKMSQSLAEVADRNNEIIKNLVGDINQKLSEVKQFMEDAEHSKIAKNNAEQVEELNEENKKLVEQITKLKETLIIKQIRNGESAIFRNPFKKPDGDIQSGVQNAVKVEKNESEDKTSQVKQEVKVKEKIKPEKEKRSSAPADDSQKAQQPKDNNQKEKKANKKEKEDKKEAAKSQAKQAAPQDAPVDIGRLDLRVGKIVEASTHPDADSLYVEKIDLGEGHLRTVISGLVKHVPLAEMQQRMVVCLCNLKPVKMRGILSEAMVMCASSPDKVEILCPPPNTVPGDVIEVDGYTRNPDAVMNPKKKIFETVAPDLKTNENKEATYKGVKWYVKDKGMVTAHTLTNVNIK